MSAVVTSATPFVTDERLAHLTPWAPLLIAGLLLLAYVWADFGRPVIGDEERIEHGEAATGDRVTVEARRRAADRG